MGISLCIAALHEAENLDVLLPEIIENLNKTGEEYEIIITDGFSTEDNTPEICKKYGAEYINQTEPGMGGAYRTAIRKAKFDKYLSMDADGSHTPSKIPEIYKMFTEKNCDIVIGSRYVQGGKTHDPWTSRIMSVLLNTTYRIFLNIDAHDLSAGFKMYRTEILKNIKTECNDFDFMQEVLVAAKLYKPDLKIGEVPIDFKERIYGNSKRNLPLFIYKFIKNLFRLKILCIKDALNKKRSK